MILFLVSHHFLASKYCRDIEVKRAMERVQNCEAIVIPIILRPCVWTSEDSAKLQVLPKNCRPLTEWPDAGFAQVAEELRTMMVDMLYPQKPNEATGGQHGNLIIKLRSRPDVDSKARAQQVLERLREYTEDFSINLQATSTTQIMDGEKAQVGLMLILTGTPEAFTVLDKAQREGQLAAAIDEDILSLYVIYGATVQSQSSVCASLDMDQVDEGSAILRPGRKIEADKMVGVFVPKGQEGSLHFIYDRGDVPEDKWQSHYESLVDYFRTAVGVKEEHQWVNLRIGSHDPEGTIRHNNGQGVSRSRLHAQAFNCFIHAPGFAHWEGVLGCRICHGTASVWNEQTAIQVVPESDNPPQQGSRLRWRW